MWHSEKPRVQVKKRLLLPHNEVHCSMLLIQISSDFWPHNWRNSSTIPHGNSPQTAPTRNKTCSRRQSTPTTTENQVQNLIICFLFWITFLNSLALRVLNASKGEEKGRTAPVSLLLIIAPRWGVMGGDGGWREQPYTSGGMSLQIQSTRANASMSSFKSELLTLLPGFSPF